MLESDVAMTTTKNEYLSALVDDETEGFETRRMLDELGRNPEDMALWGRYHLIGDAIRGGVGRSASDDFASRVSAAIAAEPALDVASPAVPGRSLFKPAAGFAMAASVAVAVLVGVMNLGGTPENVTPAPALAERATLPAPAAEGVVRVSEGERLAAGITPAPREPVAQSTRVMSRIESPDARLNSFIVNHAEHAAGRGLMPYVRVVGYETPGE